MVYQIENSASRIRGTKGFTLPELMMSIVIFGFVAAGVYSAMFSFAKATNVAMEHMEESAKNQYVLQKLQQSVRSAYEIHTSKDDEFEFSYRDYEAETLRVNLSFDKNTGGFNKSNITDDSVRSLLTDLDDVTFTYYDRFGEETSTQIDINAVKIAIKTEQTTTAGTKSVDLDTVMITFRNRSI